MPEPTRVLYNETCPVCRFEIDGYRRIAVKNKLPIRFDALDSAAAWGITPEAAAQRLHVWHEGRVLSGMPAFRLLWSQMPRWRWAAWITALPLLRPLSDYTYDHVFAPWLYRAHLRRLSQAE
jgi:predicted DCC family thiol-disulfide oxidoreductase YuxK